MSPTDAANLPVCLVSESSFTILIRMAEYMSRSCISEHAEERPRSASSYNHFAHGNSLLFIERISIKLAVESTEGGSLHLHLHAETCCQHGVQVLTHIKRYRLAWTQPSESRACGPQRSPNKACYRHLSTQPMNTKVISRALSDAGSVGWRQGNPIF